jgi:drug/metabolite transporter (DMT)-like permease
MASIFIATVPLFTALLVLVLPFFSEERLNLLGLTGLLLGFTGVGLLVIDEPGTANRPYLNLLQVDTITI